jgi:3'-phosphoadenosine 5'-phosphosulfate sulfotransferase (PAPS reductase)/FAD synthetase
MSLWLTEQGIEHDRVFLDTGWEHEKTYSYLRGELTDKLGPITEIKAPLLMEDLIIKKGMFPSRVRRFCTQELKVKPIIAYLAHIMATGTDVINAVGIRAGESVSRSKMLEWEWQDGFDCEVWRPLIAWSEAQVIAIHARHGLPPNPLYLMGASRVGCWPCIYARKSEIRLIADKDPDRIVRLRELEERVGVAARARAAAKGQTLVSDPAWFQAPLGTSGAAWPIDRVVEWSRTGKGGRQMELFAPQQEEGCVRWGLCETGAEAEEVSK